MARDRPAHYNQSDFIKSLKEIGVTEGAQIFCHSNIGFFGRAEGCQSTHATCALILEAIFSVIGDKGTLLVPTFSYSFSSGKTFDVAATSSDCGAFSEHIRNLPDSLRSNEPNISIAAIGNNKKFYTENAPADPYGDDGIFARMKEKKVEFCNFNFDAGSTYLHYLERIFQVPYRFSKEFIGVKSIEGKPTKTNSFLWVRKLEDGTEANFEKFSRIAKEKDLFKTSKIGRGFAGRITSQDAEHLFKEEIEKDPWLLTKRAQNISE